MDKKVLMNLDDDTKRAIVKYLTGGVMAGGSLALVNSLFHDLKKKQDRANLSNTADDDTLYLRTKKAFGSSEFITGPGLAFTAGGIGLAGGYMAISKAYNKIREKRLQKEFDQSQQAYIGALKSASGESGGRNFGFWEAVSGMPLTAAIVTALASGVVANKALDKAYPEPKKPTRKLPRRVVIDPEMEKESSEHLASVVMSMKGLEKISSVPDLVCAVADGRLGEVRRSVNDFGWDSALELVKGAHRDLGELEKIASCRAIIEDDLLRPGFDILVAGEFSDISPTYTKAASTLDEETSDTLVKLAAAIQQGTREDLASEILEELRAEEGAEANSDQSLNQALQEFIPISKMPSDSVNRLAEPGKQSIESE
jgi:hypothetical protein